MYLSKSIEKISNSVGRNDHFLAKARKLPILPTSLDIFYIRQYYIRILYITGHKCSQTLCVCGFSFYLWKGDMNIVCQRRKCWLQHVFFSSSSRFFFPPAMVNKIEWY